MAQMYQLPIDSLATAGEHSKYNNSKYCSLLCISWLSELKDLISRVLIDCLVLAKKKIIKKPDVCTSSKLVECRFSGSMKFNKHGISWSVSHLWWRQNASPAVVIRGLGSLHDCSSCVPTFFMVDVLVPVQVLVWSLSCTLKPSPQCPSLGCGPLCSSSCCCVWVWTAW